jgi:hypothetical protein
VQRDSSACLARRVLKERDSKPSVALTIVLTIGGGFERISAARGGKNVQ